MVYTNKVLLTILLACSMCSGVYAKDTHADSIILRTELEQNYPKSFLENGEYKGLCIDIMGAIEKESDGKISFAYEKKYFPWKRVQYNLLVGNIDIFFGLVRSSSREKSYTFIDVPLYPLKQVVAVRHNDNADIKSLSDLVKKENKGVILMKSGTALSRYLVELDKGLSIDANAKSASANLRKLSSGKGRYFYYHDLGIKSTIAREDLYHEFKILPTSFGDYYHYSALSKKIPVDVKERIEGVMKALEEKGILKQLYLAYLGEYSN